MEDNRGEEENPFHSFKDIEERTKISDVKKLIVERILEEIIDSREKYHLFVPFRGVPRSF